MPCSGGGNNGDFDYFVLKFKMAIRAQNKREYLMIIREMFILHKTYVVTPHLNRLDESAQMRGHNMVSMRK